MLEKSPYPLFALKLFGTICPCLEKEEDRPARQAAWALSSIPIRWHRRLRVGGSTSANDGSGSAASGGGVSGFISGIFGGASSATASSSMGGGGGSSVRYDSLDGASLSVIDSKFGPMLVISPPSSTIDASIRTKRIPLKMIKIVQARSGGILNSLVGSNSGIEIKDNFGREVLRFDLLKRSIPDANNNNNNNSENDWQDEEGGEMNMDLENAEEKTRDDIIDHLQILIEWERRRQAYLVTLGDDENDNSADNEVEVDEFDDDTEGGGDQLHKSSPSKKGGGGAIAEQARKIQHFAQREIEMQKLKRERENRKAKYVKEAGGLKYTAIAMANRS